MIPGSASPLLLESPAGGGGGGAYQIQRSLRMRSASSAYLSKTLGPPTAQVTFTFSAWVKKCSVNTAANTYLFTATTNNSIRFSTTDALVCTFAGTASITTTALYRDPSAWMHIVYRQTTGVGELYVNGVSVGTTATVSSVFNTAVAHQIGALNSATFFDGYIAAINFIDGQALTPASFGQIDPATGTWIANAYTGTYGVNGFYLDFNDNTALTTASNVGLGKDVSGNSNYWVTNNISVTAGATYDSMTDVPLGGGGSTGNGLGNYATLAPTDMTTSTSATQGNLVLVAGATGIFCRTRGTVAVASGKWYYETGLTAGIASGEILAGFGDTGAPINTTTTTDNCIKSSAISGTSVLINNVAQYTGAVLSATDVCGIAIDLDARLFQVFKNGSALIAPTTCTTLAVMSPKMYIVLNGGVWSLWFNFGQRPFAYTPPSGFKALHTGNLPAPAITKPNAYFDATLYTGNGAARSITNSNAMQPDLVWIKSRSAATDHKLTDSVRGIRKALSSNLTAAEVSDSNGVNAFNSNGFFVWPDANYNTNLATYVAWQWKKGATPGFDIVTYTGTGGNRTVAHALGIAPKVVLVKSLGAATDWQMYHASLANTQKMVLNTTAAAVTDATAWDSTSPTSSVFSLGTQAAVNTNLSTYVAYCFSEIDGFSKFGSYTGNGSTDGLFVYCGFRPKFVMIKESSGTSAATSSWVMHDTSRASVNQDITAMSAQSTSVEVSNALYGLDVLASGFKLRSLNQNWNESAGTYIFMAFAETPFKYALAR